jgi:aspartate aminotransferase-like enzyme
VNWEKRFADTRETSVGLRTKLLDLNFDLIGGATRTSPAVITLALPSELNSVTAGRLMQEAGFLLSYNSEYLRRNNWIQICLMGEVARDKTDALVNALHGVCPAPAPAQHGNSPSESLSLRHLP